MSLKVIARHQGATKKTEILTFDEWMTMRARLDEEIMDGCEPEGKEEDAPEEEELLALRKRHRLDVPHPVCVASFPVFPFLLYILDTNCSVTFNLHYNGALDSEYLTRTSRRIYCPIGCH